MIFRRTDPLADELRRQLEAERERTESLMQTIVEMRREGFQMPPEAPQMDSGDVGLPHEIIEAIDQRGHSRQTREKLMQEGRRLLRTGAEPSEVAERIMQGERFNWGA